MYSLFPLTQTHIRTSETQTWNIFAWAIFLLWHICCSNSKMTLIDLFLFRYITIIYFRWKLVHFEKYIPFFIKIYFILDFVNLNFFASIIRRLVATYLVRCSILDSSNQSNRNGSQTHSSMRQFLFQVDYRLIQKSKITVWK